MSGPLAWLDPGVERYLLVEDGEQMRDQVTRHWAASIWPGIRLGIGLWVLAGAFVFTSWFFWVVLLLAAAVVANAAWVLAAEGFEAFCARKYVSTKRFGHLVFENAAQDQGLREIKWVSEIDDRERLIQRVIHEAGLGTGPTTTTATEDDGT